MDWRVQVGAQLKAVDDTIQRTLRRISDIEMIEDLEKVKSLSPGKVKTMQDALNEVQHSVQATATLRDIIKLTRTVASAATKAGDAAKPEPA